MENNQDRDSRGKFTEGSEAARKAGQKGGKQGNIPGDMDRDVNRKGDLGTRE